MFIKSAVFVLALQVATSARILGVFPVPSISHQVVYRALTQELARRGHELVIITTDPVLPKIRPPDNVTEIDVHDFSYEMWNKGLSDMLAQFKGQSLPPLIMNDFLHSCIYDIFEAQLSTPQVKNLINNTHEHFDLLIVESILRPVFAFTHRFKAPVIGMSSLSATVENFESIGVPTHPLLYTDLYQTSIVFSSLWDKLDELYNFLMLRYKIFKAKKLDNRIARKHFGEDAPDISELEMNVDLLLMNVNPIWDGIRPVTPGVVYMGGMHLKSPNQLPADLTKYLDNSKHGVIYMSLGSNVKSSNLPEETLRIFLDVFRQLPYDVLWKWETDELPDKPENVRISKWLPQNDLLRHPKIKTFITQGGLQSTDEAISAQVPLIGIPFMGDQKINVQKYMLHKIGVGLDTNSLSRDALRNAINEVVLNKSYRKNIERLSQLMADQPSSPMERAMWWVEYVLRHGGARHLRGPAAHLFWYHYFMLDVVAAASAILAAALLLVISLVLFTHRLFRKIFQYKSKIKKS